MGSVTWCLSFYKMGMEWAGCFLKPILALVFTFCTSGEKEREESQRSTLPRVAELKLRLGRVKVCFAQSWPQTQAQRLDVVMMRRLGSVEGEREQPSCAHPAAGSL